MSQQQTVTVNGVLYDAHTGLRIENRSSETAAEQPAATRDKSQHAHSLHARTHRSETLNRDHVKSPASSPAKVAPAAPRPQVKQSPMISKFAKHPQVTSTTKPGRMMDIAPAAHPMMHKVAAAKPAATAHTPTLPAAKELKDHAISKALANSSENKTSLHKKSRRPRVASIAAASLAVVLLAGYLTYLNLPTISVRVAAAQAGIAATYPSNHPQGYSLNGPVAYANGQVTMKFASNTGPQNFNVNQTKSSWDSSALLTNYVEPTVGEDYMTYHDSGLTIYVYDDKAAWVNNGILHTIEGNTSLSIDQVRRIATSM
jgi:hypothetical protein